MAISRLHARCRRSLRWDHGLRQARSLRLWGWFLPLEGPPKARWAKEARDKTWRGVVSKELPAGLDDGSCRDLVNYPDENKKFISRFLARTAARKIQNSSVSCNRAAKWQYAIGTALGTRVCSRATTEPVMSPSPVGCIGLRSGVCDVKDGCEAQ